MAAAETLEASSERSKLKGSSLAEAGTWAGRWVRLIFPWGASLVPIGALGSQHSRESTYLRWLLEKYRERSSQIPYLVLALAGRCQYRRRARAGQIGAWNPYLKLGQVAYRTRTLEQKQRDARSR